MAEPKKIIIDTDPGIDDAMAIFLALQSPEVKVIGLTTIFGNVCTSVATRNSLHLEEYLTRNYQIGTTKDFKVLITGPLEICQNVFFPQASYLTGFPAKSLCDFGVEGGSKLEVAGRTDIPVAEGSHITITKGTKLRIADFVHGSDGLGNQNFSPPKSKKIDQSVADFLIEKANKYPGEVTVVALGPLTNIAMAMQLDPEFSQKIGQVILLGGSFAVNGNVNPAAEANIYGDPDAADIVFTSGADILAVGINVTHQVVLTDIDRVKLSKSNGRFAQYLDQILDVYFAYHHESYNIKGVYLHDPTCIIAAINPSLITFTEGVVRVQTTGIMRGLTLFYNKQKRFAEVTEWLDKPIVKVAVTVDAPAVVSLLMERLMNS